MRRLAAEFRPHRRLLLVVVASSVLGTGLTAVAPLLLREGVNDGVAGRTDALPWVVGGLVAIALVELVCSALRRYATGQLSLAVQHDLRERLFAAVQRTDGAGQDELQTGQVMARATTDLQTIQALLGMTPIPIGIGAQAGIALAGMLWLSPLLTLVAVVVLPAVGVVAARSRLSLFAATRAAQEQNGAVASDVERVVSGIEVVQAFGQEEREAAAIERGARRLFAQRVRVGRLQATPSASMSVLPALGQVAVLGVGGGLCLRGSADLGTLVAFSGYLVLLTAPSRLLANYVVTLLRSRASVERVHELLDSQPAVTSPEDPEPLPDGELAVELSGVRFGYVRSAPVLDGIDLRVEPGETLALVGTAGSGKSTVSLLLSRFYDVQEGRVAVGPPGAPIDVRRLALEELRAAVGVVFERPFVFAGTVRENLALADPDADEERLRAAVRDAGLQDLLDALPDGWDSEVGERGRTLSGGQRQRLGLARALVADPRVLVLDDATSAVDATTAAAITAALRRLTGPDARTRDGHRRSTILVAHRRSTIALADRIAVLDGGRVVDVGSDGELRGRCALYRELLAGPGDGAEVRRAPERAAEGTTPELWPARPDAAAAHGATAAPSRPADAAAPRPGPGTGDAPPPAAPDPALAGEPVPTPAEDAGRVARPRLAALLRPVRGGLALATLAVAVDALAAVALPLIVGAGIDHGVRADDGGTLALLVAAGVGLVALDWAALVVQGRATTRVGEDVLYRLRVRGVRRLLALDLGWHRREPAGRTMTRVTTDLDAMASFLQGGLTTALTSLALMAGMTVAMLAVDARLTLVALAVLPLLVVATIRFRRASSRAYAEARERIGTVNATIQEQVSGLRASQATRQERRAAARVRRESDAYRRARLRAQRAIALYFPTVALLSDLARAAVLGAGASWVAGGELTPGVLAAFLLYLGQFFGPVQQLSNVVDGYQQARVGLQRIGDLLATAPAVRAPAGARSLPAPLRGELALEGVAHRYRDDAPPALDGVTLRVAPGETVALVGPSGAGKSTVVGAIARQFDPLEGRVLLDGIDLREVAPDALRRRLGIVTQEPWLFEGTIADNVRYGRPDADDAAVEAALREVGGLELVRALPGGFRHPVGRDGGGLSAGQRQLVALARARLVDPDVVLLDEATAALDARSERAVLDASDRLARRRTTIVVAHRLETAARADRVVVLDGGRISEQGRHDELLGAGGAYAALWAAHEGTAAVRA